MWLRHFSKIVCASTLLLIFVGSLVTSTGSGLAVPDWPLSFGTLFPPMVGGIFYEHGHRMVASGVGLFMLILTIALWRTENRSWVKRLGLTALLAVILQGVLGGITVLFFLPTAVSVSHAVLAQTFFLLTILIAYSQSGERAQRLQDAKRDLSDILLLKFSIFLCSVIYVQLILGALMRHTASGLAIPDFPTVAGRMLPIFDTFTLQKINAWRFEMNLDSVTMSQVLIHFAHRMGAVLVSGTAIWVNVGIFRSSAVSRLVRKNVLIIDAIIFCQIILGAVTVWSQKQPWITSAHVVTGALLLGLSFLMTLRISPLNFVDFKKSVLR